MKLACMIVFFLFWNTKSLKTICDDVRLHVFVSDNLLKLIKEY
jgi:hypothetical protein